MLKKYFFIACILGNVVYAQKTDNTKLLVLDPSVKTGTLQNGMRYYIKKNEQPENRAELRLAVNSGATNETDEQQGLAHFVEHMAFNGSKNFKKNDLVNYLEGIGTKFGPDLNAYTSFDETVYMLQIPTDKKDIFNKAFLILEDWAANLSFDSLEIEKERGVVLEEWRLGQGAFERMMRTTFPAMFKDSRYANRLPIGKPEVLKTCKQHYLKDYYKDWYRPDLQAIIVVGDVDVDATEKLIKDQFSKIPKSKNPKPLTKWQIPDQKGFRAVVASDKESPYNILQLMYLHPVSEYLTVNDHRESIKQSLYNGMLSARLSELSKKPNAPFLFAGAGFNEFIRNKGAYSAFAMFPNGKAEDAITAVVTENERVKRFGFTQTEFERKKKQILNDAQNAFNEKNNTESKEIVNELVQNFLKGDACPGVEADYNLTKELLPTITLEEINALAKKWINNNGENAIAVLMLADKDGNKILTEKEVIDVFNKAEQNKDIKAYEDKVISEALVTKKPRGQKVTKTTSLDEGVTEWILGNGVRILLKPTNFKDDEILMVAHSWGGSNLYQDKEFYDADYSNLIQSAMGFGKFDATALEKYLDGKTANVYFEVADNAEQVSGNSNKKDFVTLLELVYVGFTMPKKDSAGFLSFISSRKGLIQNMSNDPNSVFHDSIKYIMSGYNIRGKSINENELNKIDMLKTHQIFKERFKDPSDFTFVFVGSFNLDSIKPLIESYIGGISNEMKHEKYTANSIVAPKGKLNKIVEKGNNPRSTVQLMWTGEFEYNRKNRFEMRALGNLLNITLRENLREDKGGVYGVGIWSQTEPFPKGKYKYTCSFSCAPDNTNKLIDAVKEEINKVKLNGCSDLNLGKIKETFIKERETAIKTNQFWLDLIIHSDRQAEPIKEINEYTAWINSLKSEDFKNYAKRYFNDNEYKQFVLNPEKK